MAKDTQIATPLTVAQRKELLALGSSMAEIRALAEDGYSFEDIKSLCETEQAAKATARQKDVDMQAGANKRAMRPENEVHPAKSVYSYPEGDVARARPEFRCKMFWAGGELQHDTSTAEEIELLNAVQPGRYACSKGDGSKIRVEVVATTDPVTGKPEKIEIKFGRSREDKDNLLSQAAMLREMNALSSALVPA